MPATLSLRGTKRGMSATSAAVRGCVAVSITAPLRSADLNLLQLYELVLVYGILYGIIIITILGDITMY